MMRLPWVLWACSQAGLQPLGEELEAVDDRFDLSGQVCASEPDEQLFPVKLLIVVDQSASLQCTDPQDARLQALAQAGAELDLLPNVEFGVVGFASWSRSTYFTSSWDEVAEALAPDGGEGGPATDYQGALSSALRLLEEDIVASGEAATTRTRYVVLFLSDGVPEPRCEAGCDDGDVLPDSLYGVCNTTEELPEGEYVGMTSPCPAYNQPEQLVEKVQDLIALGDYHAVGDISLHTVLLWAEDEVVQSVCGEVADFGYVREEAEPLLRSMAEAGRGTYRSVDTSGDLDFLDFEYASLEAPYRLLEFLPLHPNVVPDPEGALADSDGDGLADVEEFELGLDRLDPDTDGDGYGDLLEQRLISRGFQADDASRPVYACEDHEDRDGDGLSGCEEEALGSDPLLIDSDGDRLPDALELRFQLDPLSPDAHEDHDLDGWTSLDELRAGSHPSRLDPEGLERQLRVHVEPGSELREGVRCYDFEVQGMPLRPTLAEDPTQGGRNSLRLLLQEEPQGLDGSSGLFRQACVDVRYLGETYKSPAEGWHEGLEHEDFQSLAAFDADEHCAQLYEEGP